MTENERKDFFVLLADVHAFYSRDFSEFSGEIWWNALRCFDLAAVHEAFSRHCVNPDTGQYAPKPADIVRMLGGSSQDSALVAWAKVDRAVRQVGLYQSVVFDDQLIHRVLHDMGGWIPLGKKTEKDWPFVAKEFETRYRGYRIRSEVPEYPSVLVGEAEAQNRHNGQESKPPILVGDAQKATLVMQGGSDVPLLSFVSASAVQHRQLENRKHRIAA